MTFAERLEILADYLDAVMHLFQVLDEIAAHLSRTDRS